VGEASGPVAALRLAAALAILGPGLRAARLDPAGVLPAE
jgi:hypothetical protein